jgi:flagellar biosynthesis protein FlhB
MFARSRWLVSGAALLAAGATGYLFSDSVGVALRTLLEDGLAASVDLRDDPARALTAGLGRGLSILVPLLIAPVLAGALAALLPALVARRGSGQTAAPLPTRRRSAVRYALALASLGLLAAVAVLVVRGHGGEAALMASGFETGAGWIGGLVATIVAGAGAVMLLAGLADLAFERVRLLRSLRLTSGEALREDRATSGDPALRERVRARARSAGGSP